MSAGEHEAVDGTWSNANVARRRLLKGGAWGAIEFGLATLIGLPLTIVLVRVLPHRTYGSLAVAMSLCSLVGTVASVGLADGLVRTIAAGETGEGDAPDAMAPAATAFRLAVAASGIGVVLILGLAFVLDHSRSRASAELVVVGMPVAVLAPFVSLCTGLVRVSFRPGVAFLSTLLSRVVTLVGTILVLASGSRTDLPLIVVRDGATLVAVSVLVAPFLSRQIWRGPVSLSAARSVVSVGGAVLLVSLAAMAISELDVAVLGVFRGPVAAGTYAPLSRIIDVAIGTFAAFGTYALAALTGAVADGTEATARQYHWSSRAVLVLAGPILAILVVDPATVARVLFDSRAAQVTPVLRIMSLAACGHVLLGYNGLLLVALGRSRLIVTQGLVALVVSTAACFVLIPPFGLYGAAEATAIALIASNVVASLSLAKEFDVLPLDRPGLLTAAGFGVATALAGVVSHLVGGGVPAAATTFVVVFIGTGATAVAATKLERVMPGRSGT